MARVDKYDPITGGFRAHVAVDYPDADLGKLFGFGLDTTGKMVKGPGTNSGILGVWACTEKPGVVGPLREVSRLDIMREGCITDFGYTAGNPGVDFGTAGQRVFCTAAGLIVGTAAVGSYYVGCTVEPDRLEVNFNPIPLIAGQFGL